MSGDADARIDALLARAGRDLLARKGAKSADRAAFDTANSFHQAARRCAEPVRWEDGTINSPSSPMVCCLAFACELYLKSLLTAAGANARGHDLAKLFDRLASRERTAVKAIYGDLTGRPEAALRQDVAGFANAFVDWRYLFEQGSTAVSVHRLAMFAQALFRHVRAMRPDWAIHASTEANLLAPMPGDVRYMVAVGGGLTMRAVVPASRAGGSAPPAPSTPPAGHRG